MCWNHTLEHISHVTCPSLPVILYLVPQYLWLITVWMLHWCHHEWQLFLLKLNYAEILGTWPSVACQFTSLLTKWSWRCTVADCGQVSRDLWKPGQDSRCLDSDVRLFTLLQYRCLEWPKRTKDSHNSNNFSWSLVECDVTKWVLIVKTISIIEN